MAVASQSQTGERDFGCDRRTMDYQFKRAEQVETTGRRSRLSRRISHFKTRGQSAVCQLAEDGIRTGRRSGYDLLLPNQAHPRIQKTTAERTEDCGRLQPAACKSESANCAAHVFF